MRTPTASGERRLEVSPHGCVLEIHLPSRIVTRSREGKATSAFDAVGTVVHFTCPLVLGYH